MENEIEKEIDERKPQLNELGLKTIHEEVEVIEEPKLTGLGLSQDEELSLRETLKEFTLELKERIEEIKNMNLQEIIIVRDSKAGKEIQLASKKFDEYQLINWGLQSWELFFNDKNKKDILGVG